MSFVQISSTRDLSAVRCCIAREIAPNAAAWDNAGHFPLEVFVKFHQLGLMAAGWHTSANRSPWEMIDLLEIASELGYASVGVFTSWIGNLLVQTALSRFGSARTTSAVSSEQAERRSLLAFCATELATGTDILRMHTTARPGPSGFLLSGEKHFITNANHASHFVVFAQVPDRGLTAFLVPASAPGVAVGPPLQKLGLRESNTSSVSFDEVRVPAENRVGEFGDAYRILMTCVSRTKTLIAGAAVGVCRRAEAEAIDYLKRAVRYGEPLLARREIQAQLAELRTRREAAWLLACRAGAIWDREGIAISESAMAKLYATDLATHTVSEALELSGASGYMQDSFLSKLYRDVKVMEIYEGASLVQQALIAKEAYGPILKELRQKAEPRREAA